MFYLVQDGSHVDVVCKTMSDVAFEMMVRYSYFKEGMFDCYYTPEQKNIKKGFTFYALDDEKQPMITSPYQYFCTYTKIDSIEGLSREVLMMSDLVA